MRQSIGDFYLNLCVLVYNSNINGSERRRYGNACA